MKVTLYMCNDDPRTLNKSMVIFKTVNARIKKPCSVEAPALELFNIRPSNVVKFNYIFIPELARYYFVNDRKMLSNDILEIGASVDVLQSFNAGIRDLQILVDRQENINSAYIIDNELPTFTNRIISQHVIGSVPVSTGNNITLTVTGG